MTTGGATYGTSGMTWITASFETVRATADAAAILATNGAGAERSVRYNVNVADSTIYTINTSVIRNLTGNNTPGIRGFRDTAASFTSHVNGTATTMNTAVTYQPAVNQGFQLGQWNIGYLTGFVFECIVYDTALSLSDYQKVEGYLAWKWGFQSRLAAGHPYLTNAFAPIFPRLPYIIPMTIKQTKDSVPPYFARASGQMFKPISVTVITTVGSLLFNTTPSQYLSIPNSTAFTQNTAFTYEFWYYPTSTNTGYLVAMLQPNWITVRWNTGTAGTIGLDMSYVGNAPGYTPQNRIYAINRWHHIALTWNGTNGVLYMNGVSEAVFTGAGGLVNAGSDLRIGQYQGQGQPTPLGYITNFRWVKGVSVYTGAFTPPTAPLTVTQSAGTNISAITAGQTQLLLLAVDTASSLKDSSTNNFTVTNNGSITWNALTPFSVYATGGTITFANVSGIDYRIHTFTTVGTANFTLTSPASVITTVLVVAGGGAGGFDDGGGGGAGGVIYNAAFTITSGSYTVTVGNGGASNGASGGNSVLSSLTAIGGGGGANGNANGSNGGSGGGLGWGVANGSTPGSGTEGQGFAGGGGTTAPNYAVGGGGGAGGVGGTGSGITPGNGGIGVSHTIAGTTYNVGGGGGGGLAVQNSSGTNSTASFGGGNGAGRGANAAVAGTPNTGGGGGGANNEQATNGAFGGSGIVIIAYQYQ